MNHRLPRKSRGVPSQQTDQDKSQLTINNDTYTMPITNNNGYNIPQSHATTKNGDHTFCSYDTKYKMSKTNDNINEKKAQVDSDRKCSVEKKEIPIHFKQLNVTRFDDDSSMGVENELSLTNNNNVDVVTNNRHLPTNENKASVVTNEHISLSTARYYKYLESGNIKLLSKSKSASNLYKKDAAKQCQPRLHQSNADITEDLHSVNKHSYSTEVDAETMHTTGKTRLLRILQSISALFNGKEKSPKPTSLKNSGVNCYLNSALQGISSCAKFIQEINSLKSQHPQLKKLATFASLIEQLFHGKSSLKISNNAIFREWNMSGQQDSYELLTFVLNEVYNELRRETEKTDKVKEWLKVPLPLRILMEYEIRCDCGRISTTPLQTDLAFHVTMTGNKDDNLQALFDLYFKADIIDGYQCDSCVDVPAYRQVKLCTPLPTTICVHLQRTRYKSKGLKKITDKIRFSLSLVIKKEFCKVDSVPTVDKTYSLVSVIVHHGGLSTGHYICYKLFKGDWFRTSDLSVHKVTREVVSACQAYILFYEVEESDKYPPCGSVTSL